MLENWLERPPTQEDIEKQAREESEARAKETNKLAIAYLNTFVNFESGKSVLEDLRRKCGGDLAVASATDSHVDVPQTMINIGVNSVLRYIEQEIEMAKTFRKENP